MFKRKSTTPKSEAPEAVRIAPNIQALVWSVVGLQDRTHKLHFRLERVASNGRTFRTLRPEHLLELPSGVALLAGGFAKVATLPQPLRENLKRLATLLDAVHTELASNGAASEDASDEENIFG